MNKWSQERINYKTELDSISPSFCSAKWTQTTIHLGLGHTHSCHHPRTHVIPVEEIKKSPDALHNTSYKKQQRQLMLDGIRPQECNYCWKVEDAGEPLSDRILKSYESWSRPFLKEILDADSTKSINPKYLEVSFDNVCNLKCRICGPQASSTFLKEYQERFNIKIEDGSYWLSNKILGTTNEDVILQWAQDLIHLEITGGEPMASPENIKILELLINSGQSDRISILLNTNGTLYNKKFLDLLIKFKEVTICISVDDLGERLEYERYPTEWTTVQHNITKFIALKEQNSNLFLTLCPTVSVFNVYYMSEFLQWSKGIDIFTYFNILHYPPSHIIKNLPDRLKEQVSARLTAPEFTIVRNFLNLPADDQTLIKEFITKNTELDLFRKQDFKTTFGVWGQMIMDYKDE
jgi:sulfatase maturation enzyme AslB (radical SAM superfamily)